MLPCRFLCSLLLVPCKDPIAKVERGYASKPDTSILVAPPKSERQNDMQKVKEFLFVTM